MGSSDRVPPSLLASTKPSPHPREPVPPESRPDISITAPWEGWGPVCPSSRVSSYFIQTRAGTDSPHTPAGANTARFRGACSAREHVHGISITRCMQGGATARRLSQPPQPPRTHAREAHLPHPAASCATSRSPSTDPWMCSAIIRSTTSLRCAVSVVSSSTNSGQMTSFMKRLEHLTLSVVYFWPW